MGKFKVLFLINPFIFLGRVPSVFTMIILLEKRRKEGGFHEND
jgi:hypothetical protein